MRLRFLWAPLVVLLLVIVAKAAQHIIGVGTTANDATGDTLRVSFQKVNSNFTEVFGWQTNGMPFTNRAGNPSTPATNNFILFSKSVGGVAKPHFMDDAGNVVSLGASAVAGSTGQVQWNSNNVLTADSLFAWDGTTKTLSAPNVSASTQANFALVGIKSATPTHSLTLGSTGNGLAAYSTADQTVNYNRTRLFPGSLVTEGAGSQTASDLILRAGNTLLTLSGDTTPTMFSFVPGGAGSTASGSFVRMYDNPSSSSGINSLLTVAGSMSQSGSAGYYGLELALTQDSIGTGAKYPLHITLDGAPLVTVTNSGGVGIGTAAPAASALVDLTSTTKGVLIPRLTSAQEAAISSPATGLLIFNTTSNLYRFYMGSAWTNLGVGITDDMTLTNLNLAQFDTNSPVSIKSGAVVTNMHETGTHTANAFVATNDFYVLTNPVAFGLLRADSAGTRFTGTTNVSDLQATNLTVVNNTTLQNLTVNNTFTVAGKNGMSGTLTAGFVPMAGTASIFSNSIAEQIGVTNILTRGSQQITNALAVQSLTVSNTASGITPTAGAHFATKGYVDTSIAQQGLPMPHDWLLTVCYPRSDSATLVSLGEVFSATGTPAAQANTAAKPGHLQCTSGTVLGNIACWESGTTAWATTRTNIFDVVVSLDQSVSNRFWAGFFTANAASSFAVDDPNTATMAFRFSPQEAGDTHLMAYTQQDASPAAVDVASTGLTVVSNTLYRLSIVQTPLGTVSYYTNGVLAYTTSTMPTNSGVMRVMWGVSTRVSGASRAFDWWGTSIKQGFQ